MLIAMKMGRICFARKPRETRRSTSNVGRRAFPLVKVVIDRAVVEGSGFETSHSVLEQTVVSQIPIS
jgi:hypothetical protein